MKLTGKLVAVCMAVLMIVAMASTIVFAASSDTDAEISESTNAEISAIETEKSSSADGSTKYSRPSNEMVHSYKKKNGTHVNVISVAASVLGKTTDEVKEAIKEAKVGDLLIEAGKVDEFKTAYLTEAKTKLDEAIASGTLTQEEADTKYAEIEAAIAVYDGTTHLCGGTDHKKMFSRDKKTGE